MFRAHVLIIRRSKLHYTASGIITPIGDRLVYVIVCRWPSDMQEHMLLHTRRSSMGVMIPEAV